MTGLLSDRDILLHAVLEEPFDDSHRLILADCLDEHEEPERAEFIRLQVFAHNEWASNKGVDHHICERFRELMHCSDMKETVWLSFAGYHLEPAGLYEIDDGYLTVGPTVELFFTRGFISEIRLSCKDFMTHAKGLFSSHPIIEVAFTDKMPLRGDSWFNQRGVKEMGLNNFDPQSDLPEEIFSKFAAIGVNHCGSTIVTLNESEQGYALSRACVAYGRELAGLPPLDWSKFR